MHGFVDADTCSYVSHLWDRIWNMVARYGIKRQDMFGKCAEIRLSDCICQLGCKVYDDLLEFFNPYKNTDYMLNSVSCLRSFINYTVIQIILSVTISNLVYSNRANHRTTFFYLTYHSHYFWIHTRVSLNYLCVQCIQFQMHKQISYTLSRK